MDVKGSPKNLFSVLEIANRDDRSKTDLNIHFSSGGKIFRGESVETLIRPPPTDQYQDCHIHFSVHASVKSATVNSIHREVMIAGQSTGDSVLLTTALKKDHLFAPLTFVICGDFKNGRFDIPENDISEIVTLGQLDPDRDQFRFMVVLAEAGKLFPYQKEHPSRFLQYHFQDYELIVISSYFNMPAQPHMIDLVPFTTKEGGPQRGFYWQEVYNLYTDWYMLYAQGYFDQIGKERSHSFE
ncbi:hypothetical protein AB7813_08740 [Tardiphaga sp. 20_F10_N6_6]|uniref:hypothetical protein n=1 Tax=Tardiphaga sp. 20_F10_N6_6 TaxID=3240788 RepID=UPI003F8A74AA